MADLQGQAFEGSPVEGESTEGFGVSVPLDDLGRDRIGPEPQELADPGLKLGGAVGVGPHGAGDLAHGALFARAEEPLPIAAKLGVEIQQLQAEGSRLRMNPMGPSRRGGQAVLEGLAAQLVQQVIQGGDQHVQRVPELKPRGRVQHVAAGQPQMDKASRGTDPLRHSGDEGDDVVLRPGLDLPDPIHVESRPLLDLPHRLRRDLPPLGPGPAGGELHRQQPHEAGLFGPDRLHLRRRVPLDHGRSSSRLSRTSRIQSARTPRRKGSYRPLRKSGKVNSWLATAPFRKKRVTSAKIPSRR